MRFENQLHNHAMFVIALAVSVLLVCQNAPGDEVPAGGVSLLGEQPTDVVQLAGVATDHASLEWVEVRGMPFDRAARVQTRKRPDRSFEMQLVAPTSRAVQKDDTVLAVFYIRGIGGPARGEFYFEGRENPWPKSVVFPVNASTEWKRFLVPFKVRHDLSAGGAHMTFRVGFDPQHLEFGGLDLLHYGQEVDVADLPRAGLTYPGHEPDAAWRAEAEARIQEHRKAELSVVVTGADGQAIPSARVHVQMRRHAFQFGGAVNATTWAGLNRRGGGRMPEADLKRYRQAVLEHFPYVVIENSLKWRSWETASVQKRARDLLAWLDKHDIEVRGHYLVNTIDKFMPDDIRSASESDDAEHIWMRMQNHTSQKMLSLADQIREWDAINHPVITDTDETTYDRVLGREWIANLLALARETDAEIELYINEGSILTLGDDDAMTRRDDLARLLKMLEQQGAQYDGLGFMGHFDWRLTAPERVLQILDQFAVFGRPMKVTEYDIAITDEQLAADYTRDFMVAVFSHPETVGFVNWGFWDGSHWMDNAIMYRRDWSLKPSGRVWLDLVYDRWWTDIEQHTDKDGELHVQGFLGDYQITVEHAGQRRVAEVTLPSSGQAVHVQFDKAIVPHN